MDGDSEISYPILENSITYISDAMGNASCCGMPGGARAGTESDNQKLTRGSSSKLDGSIPVAKRVVMQKEQPWTPAEDKALRDAVDTHPAADHATTTVQGNTARWKLVSSIVNSSSKTRRGKNACRRRYLQLAKE